MKMSKFFSILFFIFSGLFIISHTAVAAGDPASIIISRQPVSSKSVDFILSQQPILLVKDSDGSPVPDVTVVAFTNGKGNLSGDLAEVTDSNGLATFKSLRYSGTDDFTIVFGSSGGSATSNSIKLSSGLASAVNSSISVSPTSVVADGESVATLKVYCKDRYKNIVSDAKIGVSSSGSDNTFSQTNVEDNPGTVTVTLSTTKAESKIILVTVDGVSVGNSEPINFVPGKIAKLSIVADSPIDTKHTSSITITGKDKFDNIITNDSTTSLSLSVDNSGSLSSALVTLERGIASTTLSKNSPGVVNFIASNGNTKASAQIVFTSSDIVAPEILNQYPASNATGVAVNVMPHIDFSKIMDVASLTTEGVQLRKFTDNSVISADVLISNGQKRVILQPTSNLDTNTKYYLHVDASVRDMAGNVLGSPYDSGFFVTASDPTILLSGQSAGENITQKNDQSGTQNLSHLTKGASGPIESSENSVTGVSENLNNSGTISGVSSSSNDTTDQKDGNLGDNLFDSSQAGLLGGFKNFDIKGIIKWLIGNYFSVVSILIIVSLGYVFWRKYLK